MTDPRTISPNPLPTTEGVTHTPGPWVVRTIKGYGFDQVRSTDEDLCICDVDMLGMPNRSLAEPGIYSGQRIGIAELHANARLISAAPDLLSALKAFLKMYLQGANSGDWGNWDPEQQPEIIAVRAAIAKTLPPPPGQ